MKKVITRCLKLKKKHIFLVYFNIESVSRNRKFGTYLFMYPTYGINVPVEAPAAAAAPYGAESRPWPAAEKKEAKSWGMAARPPGCKIPK